MYKNDPRQIRRLIFTRQTIFLSRQGQNQTLVLNLPKPNLHHLTERKQTAPTMTRASLKRSPAILVVLALILVPEKVECGIYKMMAEAMMGHMMDSWGGGGDSKGVTFGLKSKGMTAIIPIPLPMPIFSKDKGGGGGGGQKVKYIPVPVPSGGGKEDWW